MTQGVGGHGSEPASHPSLSRGDVLLVYLTPSDASAEYSLRRV